MWSPPYGEESTVPACEADAQRVERGDEPQHLHVDVERADVVAERDQVVARVALGLLELDRGLRAPLAPGDEERRGARAEQDQTARPAVTAAVAATAAA